jgi:type VI secretion system secreted protein Hcp
MAVDYFLKIEGIKGESTDSKHKEEIDVESWSWGETQVGASGGHGGGAGAGKVSMQDFTFTMQTNKASPTLMLACATGQHITEATLSARKAGGEQQDYLKIVMQDLIIANFQLGASNEIPRDQVAINFSKISFEYKEQKPDGTLGSPVKTGYDLKANKKI